MGILHKGFAVEQSVNLKVWQVDMQLNFVVNKISINMNGSALLLANLEHLYISNAIRMLQVSWHSYSDTHLEIPSSDSILGSLIYL